MRRSRDSGVRFDSFPFLNVMIGMIVILLLFMLMIVTTRAVSREKTPDLPPVPVADVPPPDAGTDANPDAAGPGDLSEEEFRDLQTQIQKLEAAVAEQRGKLEDLLGTKNEIENLLLAKQDEINLAALSGDGRIGGYIVGEPIPTVMIPDASVSVSKRPQLVEVDAERYTFHAESGPQAHPVGDLKSGTALDQAIQRVDRNRGSEYLLLLVHPNGAEAYETFRKYLLNNYSMTTRKPSPIPGIQYVITKSRIDLGVEPFAQEWLLIARPKGAGANP
jgi:hypothetical protein